MSLDILTADIIFPTAQECVSLTELPNSQAAVSSWLVQKPERIIVVADGANGCTVLPRQADSISSNSPLKKLTLPEQETRLPLDF